MPRRSASLAARTLLLLVGMFVLGGMQPSVMAQSSSSGDPSQGPDQASGQGRHPGPPSPGMELDRIIKATKAAEVPLSDPQKVSILGILEDKETAQKSLQNSSTDRSAMMQQMQALEKASRTAILAVLNEAQAKVYESLRQQGPGRGPSGMPPPGGPPAARGAAPSGSADPTENLIDANTGGGQPQSAR